MSEVPFFMILIGGLIFAVFIGLAILGWRQERRRREAIAMVAERLGFRLSPGNDSDLAYRHREFRGLSTGDNRYAFNVLEGNRGGRHIVAFDFHYETSSTDSEGRTSTTSHYLHVVMLYLEREFPALFVAPENVFSKIAQALGHDDIDFESAEFSRRFCVRSADRKFAYDFCNTSMMEFLLANRDLQLETREGILAIIFNRCIDPQRIETEIDLACTVRDRMPDYLFADA